MSVRRPARRTRVLPAHRFPPCRQRGAALLLAMLVLTLVSTLAAGMVWQQWRAIEVETAERARTQSAWILSGALDWARLILREDARHGGPDHLGEPWAVPLAEARLSTFLAADRDNTVGGDDGPEAFLAGSITDAQSRYNLRNLLGGDGKPVEAQTLVLQRLCEAAGVPSDSASRIVAGLIAAWSGAADAAIPPERVSQLVWFGLDPAVVATLERWIVLLPVATPLNVNTASRETIAAVLNIDAGSAERLVEHRQRTPFRSLAEVKAQLPPELPLENAGIGVASSYFEVQGRLRLGERVLEQRSLVQRQQLQVRVLSSERVNLSADAR